MEAPSATCPTCATPRGTYDRYCTGCGEDLGSPAALDLSAFAAPAPARATGRTLVRSAPVRSAERQPVAVRPGGGRSVAGVAYRPVIAIVGRPTPGGSAAAMRARAAAPTGGLRLWATLGNALRLVALFYLALVGIGIARSLQEASDAGLISTSYLVGVAIAGVLFLLVGGAMWGAKGALIAGTPPLIRPIALLFFVIATVLTFGLALVVLIGLYLVTPDPLSPG